MQTKRAIFICTVATPITPKYAQCSPTRPHHFSNKINIFVFKFSYEKRFLYYSIYRFKKILVVYFVQLFRAYARSNRIASQFTDFTQFKKIMRQLLKERPQLYFPFVRINQTFYVCIIHQRIATLLWGVLPQVGLCHNGWTARPQSEISEKCLSQRHNNALPVRGIEPGMSNLSITNSNSMLTN